jgi:hypothetical protein
MQLHKDICQLCCRERITNMRQLRRNTLKSLYDNGGDFTSMLRIAREFKRLISKLRGVSLIKTPDCWLCPTCYQHMFCKKE